MTQPHKTTGTMNTDRNNDKNKERTPQLWCAMTLVGTGCLLLGAGFVAPPPGEIHSSILVAFGETLTFAGALFGIDWRWRRHP